MYRSVSGPSHFRFDAAHQYSDASLRAAYSCTIQRFFFWVSCYAVASNLVSIETHALVKHCNVYCLPLSTNMMSNMSKCINQLLSVTVATYSADLFATWITPVSYETRSVRTTVILFLFIVRGSSLNTSMAKSSTVPSMETLLIDYGANRNACAF